MPDWAVCDTIANGSRMPERRRGIRGGTIERFRRTYPLDGRGESRPGSFRGEVEVLCELTPRGCFALRLLSPAKGGKKTGMIWDF